MVNNKFVLAWILVLILSNLQPDLNEPFSTGAAYDKGTNTRLLEDISD